RDRKNTGRRRNASGPRSTCARPVARAWEGKLERVPSASVLGIAPGVTRLYCPRPGPRSRGTPPLLLLLRSRRTLARSMVTRSSPSQLKRDAKGRCNEMKPKGSVPTKMARRARAALPGRTVQVADKAGADAGKRQEMLVPGCTIDLVSRAVGSGHEMRASN